MICVYGANLAVCCVAFALSISFFLALQLCHKDDSCRHGWVFWCWTKGSVLKACLPTCFWQ